MERTLFDNKGEAVAYITTDYHESIYLWDGYPVAYLYNEQHIYGINGRHLGWLINDILYDNSGARIGFTFRTCPVATAKEPAKAEKFPMDELRSRWSAPPTPKLSYGFSDQSLADFLKEGQIVRFPEEPQGEESEDSET
ncbi:MAG: 4-fold beta flower protein [Pseudomonadota bacterium]